MYSTFASWYFRIEGGRNSTGNVRRLGVIVKEEVRKKSKKGWRERRALNMIAV